MIEFGKTLREAREAKGLSISQLAELTNMPSSRIEQLEKEDFSHIPAAIYGRGFVRLYCEAVGLDPKPLAAEFTEIFNGNRDLEIKEKAPQSGSGLQTASEIPTNDKRQTTNGVLPPPAAPQEPVLPAGAPSPAPAAETPSPAASPSDFHLESREIRPAQPAAAMVGRGVPAAPQPDPIPEPPPLAHPLAEKPPRPEKTISRYAAPLDEQPRPRASFAFPSLSIPPAVWRLGLLAIVAIALVWLLCLGIGALYRTVTGGDNEDNAALVEPVPVETAAPQEPVLPAGAPSPAESATPAAPRTPQKIPPLYLN